MARLADCRRCICFRLLGELQPELAEEARRWVEANRPGERPLGDCERFRRPVTYYVGRCSGYQPRQLNIKNRTLDEFLGG